MSATATGPAQGRDGEPAPAWQRVAPILAAAVLALAYVIVSPPSLDLAAHLFRAKLFSIEGFGLWDNYWYAGHHTPGYSVLFPPLAALLTPQIVGALSAVATAAVFEPLARRRFGRQAWLGTLWFGAATAVDLYTGRLTFAFGLLPCVGVALALQRRRDLTAAGLAVLTALASPVAALFAALVAAACAVARWHAERRLKAALAPVGVAAAALVPVLILTVLFPEGGSEPFTFATLWPIPLIAVIALIALPRRDSALRAGIVLYVAGCLIAYAIVSPVGSNAARLAPLLAGPIAALIWWPKRRALLLAIALPTLYIQWQAPVRDARTAWGDPSTEASYYQPVLRFLARQSGGPFRVEVPFTRFHGEAYYIAPSFPLARGWERQLDIKDNTLFYSTPLTPATYYAWLRSLAIHYVAVSEGPVDYSAKAEIALLQRGLPYLTPVMHSRYWQIYAVRGGTPLSQGAASVTALGANSVTLHVTRPGSAFLRVRFTPYWRLTGVPGCVAKAGEFTRVSLRSTGTAKLVIAFSLRRIAATNPRC
ncbi:MAG: hypothetical protein QOG59_453 [Solirubrobacteraceae bacterium]|nr:hypothetical protein [Solirubrobacteraceae bacterium]